MVVLFLLLIPSPLEKEPQSGANECNDSECNANNDTGERTLAKAAAATTVTVDDLAIYTIAVAVAVSSYCR